MSEPKTIDRVCGMTISTVGALMRVHEGDTYHFFLASGALIGTELRTWPTSRFKLEGWGDLAARRPRVEHSP